VTRPALDTDALAAWRRFLQTHAALLSVLERELLEERGLPIAYYDVLFQLSDAGGRLRMSDLAERLLVSRSGVTRLVARMVGDGLVRREPCPTDRRGAFAVLTARGRDVLRKAGPTHLRGVRRYFVDALEPGDARTLVDVFDRIRERTTP
jgi:DNA-binding MarR family transcriptional regulator